MSSFIKALSRYALATISVLALSACSLPPQSRDEVLVRASGQRHYDMHADMLTLQTLKTKAEEHWEYAVMSENAYHGSDYFPVGIHQKAMLDRCPGVSASDRIDIINRENPRLDLHELRDANDNEILAPTGWRESNLNEAVLSDHQIWCNAAQQGLAFKIYERTHNNVRQIAISFRGTVFSYGPNWRSNFRWFLPGMTKGDANSIVQNDITRALAQALVQQYGSPEAMNGKVEIVATGHSLGGALAQQFAYAFPPREYAQYSALRLRRVIAFDPSPANGWYWVDQDTREKNSENLLISRVFQHGEGLAYFRLLLSYVFPPSDGSCDAAGCHAPKIEEIRYNRLYTNTPSRNPVANHSMRNLAAGLAALAGHEPANFAGP